MLVDGTQYNHIHYYSSKATFKKHENIILKSQCLAYVLIFDLVIP